MASFIGKFYNPLFYSALPHTLVCGSALLQQRVWKMVIRADPGGSSSGVKNNIFERLVIFEIAWVSGVGGTSLNIVRNLLGKPHYSLICLHLSLCFSGTQWVRYQSAGESEEISRTFPAACLFCLSSHWTSAWVLDTFSCQYIPFFDLSEKSWDLNEFKMINQHKIWKVWHTNPTTPLGGGGVCMSVQRSAIVFLFYSHPLHAHSYTTQ